MTSCARRNLTPIRSVETATVQFGFDDAVVQAGINRMVSNIEATSTRLDRSLTLTPSVDASAMARASQAIRDQWSTFVNGIPLGRSEAFLDKVYAQIDAQTAAMNGAVNRASQRSLANFAGGGGASRNAGLIGQQLQDVFVQLQGGTNPLTIMAQQGSQLASIFGPTGMVFGAMAAGVGRMLSVGQNARKMFDAMITGAADAHTEIEGLLNTGGVKELETALGRMGKREKELADARKSQTTIGGILSGGLGLFSGGDTLAGQRSKQIKAEGEAFWDKAALQQRIVEASKEELKIGLLRTQGRNEEADAEERKLTAKRKIAEISAAPGLSSSNKIDMIKDVDTLLAAQNAAAKEGKSNKDYEQRQKVSEAVKKQLDDNYEKQRQLDFEQLDTAGKLKAVQERIAQLKNLSDGTDKLGDAQRAGQIIELLGTQLGLQKQLTAEVERKKQAEQAFNDMVDAENASIEEDKKKAHVQTLQRQIKEKDAKAKQLESVYQMEMKAAIDEAKAHGHKRKAQRLETELATDNLAKQMMDQTGMSPEAARQKAAAMQRNMDRASGKPTTIHGGKSGGFEGIGGHKFDALDKIQSGNAWNWNGQRLRDTFTFPGLDRRNAAADLKAKNHQNAARQAAHERQVSIAEGGQLIALLTSIDGKFTGVRH